MQFQVEDHTLHVYLADFGLGHIINATIGIGTATMQAGTPGFQAPEQLKGESIGVSCDVYALGVLTKLFGKQPLWDKMAPHTIMYKVAVEGVFPKTEHLPDSICNVAKHCLCYARDRKSAPSILCMLIDIHVSE